MLSHQTLFLFVGYPGAGKTTVSKILAEYSGALHVWADHERRAMFTSPDHSIEESRQLYTELNARAERLLAEGNSVIFDTNFNYYADRQHLRNIAEKYGARCVVVWVNTPLELAHKRAVHEAEGEETRLYGNMSDTDFDRIVGRLEPPKEDERVIKIDGTNLDQTSVLAHFKDL